jgi:pyridoxamine 5'-phosphate oxidase
LLPLPLALSALLPSAMDLAAIRKNYSLKELTEASVQEEPLGQFSVWMEEAIQAGVPEPTAMVLSTVNAEGLPSARVVLLKGIQNQGFAFFTNYQSRKGQELAENPRAALTFFWPELERQVRIEGEVAKVPEDVSDAYFQSRPPGSQIAAWASPQSMEVDSRETIEKAVHLFSEKHAEEGKIGRPLHWGGYAVFPKRVEFWQGRPNRLHDRILYKKNEEGEWSIVRLAP